MRMLLVGAGAGFSIADVETGYLNAFKAAGVDVYSYALEARLGTAHNWLKAQWKARGKPSDARPTWADTIYRASIEALEMALRFRVDWVVAISGMFLHPDALALMRRAGLRTAIILTESPYQDEEQARVASIVDVCWTNERTSVPFLRRFNPRTFYLRAAYDPIRHTPLAEVDATAAAHDVVFVGSGFQERIDLLSAVDWTGIDLGLYGTWNLLPSRHKLRQYLKGGLVNNETTAALYRQAKIGLNLHRTSRQYAVDSPRIDHAESMNPRAYELAACGVFQISDERAEMYDLFDGDLMTFDSVTTLESQIRAGLGWTPKIRALHAGFVREAVQGETFAARAAQVLADLGEAEQPIAKGA